MIRLGMRLCLLLPALLAALPASAQTPRVAPSDGFGFLDERTDGVLTVQRWIRDGSPEVSPAGMCECVHVVYLAGSRILTLNPEGVITSLRLDPRSGRDITGDSTMELIVSQWSGGAHCCTSTQVYSIESDQPRVILSEDTGNCTGEFEDVDGDGDLEFRTCDDSWAYSYCAFAFSPMPTVIYAYDAASRRYVLATPKYSAWLRPGADSRIAEAEKALSDPQRDAGLEKCTVLGPVLELIYMGRLDDGVALLRRSYPAEDRDEFEAQVLQRVKESPLWTAP